MAKRIKMTPQAAIEIITNAIQTDNMTVEQDVALSVVQKAVEKQIPKNPIGKTDPIFGDTTTCCPTCENTRLVNPFSGLGYKCCPECGQVFDWEVQE